MTEYIVMCGREDDARFDAVYTTGQLQRALDYAQLISKEREKVKVKVVKEGAEDVVTLWEKG